MRWNPFLTKRGRIIVIAVVVFLLPTGYLASYPIAYRLLVGSDVNSLRLFSSMGTVWQYRESSSEEFQRRELWQLLQSYCFPPVEWLIDHTLFRHPILVFAKFIDTDEQLKDDFRQRSVNRQLKVILASGNRAALVEFMIGSAEE